MSWCFIQGIRPLSWCFIYNSAIGVVVFHPGKLLWITGILWMKPVLRVLQKRFLVFWRSFLSPPDRFTRYQRVRSWCQGRGSKGYSTR